MQPIINWTQWKWSRQFWGTRNLSNCKSIAPPPTAAWPVGMKRNAGSIPTRQLQVQMERFHNWFIARGPVKNYAVAMIFFEYIINIVITNQCYLCVVFGLSLSSLTRYKGMSKIKYKVMSGPSWTFIRFQNNSGSPNMSIILGLT